MHLASLLATAALSTTALSQQCYYPSGKVATADIPCSTSSDNKHCCGKTGICLSNGYCMETSQQSGPLGLYRGSCTDRNWGSSCPQQCLEDNDFPADATRVARWKKNESDWLYCCVGSDYGSDSSSSACADGADPFTIPSASLIYRVAVLSSAEVISSTASSTALSAASTSPATATPAAASETSRAAGDTCPDSGTQIGAIGAGVGVLLGVISIGSIVWALWERRQRRRAGPAHGVSFHKPGYEVAGGFQYGNSSTPVADSLQLYSTPAQLARPHELGPNEHKVELPGSVTSVSPRG